MSNNIENSFNYHDMKSLSQLKYQNTEANETLEVAAKQLEAVFLQMVLKSMRDANESFKSDMFSSNAEDFYQDMFDHQLTLNLSQTSGLGLSDVIVRQLSPQKHQNELNPKTTEEYRQAVVPMPVIRSNKQTDAELSRKEAVFEDAKSFVKTLLPMADKALRKLGFDPKLVLAQAALETGWGQHIMQDKKGESSFNLFGIKASKDWQGKVVEMPTLEYQNGIVQKENAKFRSYESFAQSFEDYVNFLKNDRYENVMSSLKNPKAYLENLQKSGYATDPNYAEKIYAIYKSTRFNELF